MARPTRRVPQATAAPTATVVHVASLIEQIDQISEPEELAQKMPNDSFDADITVIGAGPGGYVAAIRAAQLGQKTICVEKEYLGGTCLNWGCIPSKAMIASVERLHHVRHADQLGVVVGGEAHMDLGKFAARRDKIVTTLRGGVGMLLKKNGVRHVEGFAKFVDPHTIEVEKEGKKEKITSRHFVLAMGSSVIRLNIPGLEGDAKDGIWTSDDAVTCASVPKSMVILGGGAVGVEFGYVFNGLGSDVTVVEMMPTLIPVMDTDLGNELGKLLGRQGVKVKTGATVEKVEKIAGGWRCHIKKGADTEVVEAEVVLLGVGRKANTDGMNLEGVGVKLHRRGVEVVDDTLRTHVPNIYAVGDVRGRIQLAHVASAEGVHAVHNIVKGTNKLFNYKAVPACVYTVPEVASVGLTQSEAEAQGYDVTVGKFNFRPLGKAMAIAEPDGFIKVVADRKYGEVLGVHMIGAHVTDMINAAVVALTHEATLESLVETIHAHPTMSEAFLEAYEDALGHAIHKV